MSNDESMFQIYAIRYGSSVRKRSESFIGGDLHDGPMEMAYYVWLVQNEKRAVVFDTGFAPDVGKTRAREFLTCPGEAMRKLGTDPDSIKTVVLSHLHYDHAGNHHLFPHATFHVQASEMDYATGPWMQFQGLRIGYEAEDLKMMVDRVFDERVKYHEGDSTLAPGLTLLHMGGHCKGLQALVVSTERGPVVLASDSAVFYEGLETGRAFPAAFHVGEELAGYNRLMEVAGSIDAIIPGHDTRVMEYYPEIIEGIAWQVDLAPITT
ncbi:MAG: N-acyl homoserine lactonase family protein [Paracoccaceae bacterium]|jgi:glyoxylase-like metal-dependent hydrolase (beta-lactamase superfamily II)|nr:N-acyl homoserine lactonase family protein [Paracoccaceae bacterium]